MFRNVGNSRNCVAYCTALEVNIRILTDYYPNDWEVSIYAKKRVNFQYQLLADFGYWKKKSVFWREIFFTDEFEVYVRQIRPD